MMRTARPGSTGIDGGAPAAMVPATSSSTGGSATSPTRTAYPSTAELSNGGTSSAAARSAAVTCPSDSPSATVVTGRRGQASRT